MIKSAVRIQGHCKGAKLPVALRALNFIERTYENMDDGLMYLEEAVGTCRQHIDNGIVADDNMLAAALLHNLPAKIGVLDEKIEQYFGKKVLERIRFFFRGSAFKYNGAETDECCIEDMHKEAVYVLGFAEGAKLALTVKALHFIIKTYSGRKRRDNSPMSTHSINVCRYLINHGETDDVTLAAALLHDILEDTEFEKMYLTLNFNMEVADIVDLVSKKSWIPPDEYHAGIRTDIRAIKIKAADRACNFDTAIGVYDADKLEEKNAESKYIFENMKWARGIYLDDSDLLVALRDHIKGVIKAFEEVIRLSRIIKALKVKIRKLAKEKSALRKENKELRKKMKI